MLELDDVDYNLYSKGSVFYGLRGILVKGYDKLDLLGNRDVAIKIGNSNKKLSKQIHPHHNPFVNSISMFKKPIGSLNAKINFNFTGVAPNTYMYMLNENKKFINLPDSLVIQTLINHD